MIIPKITYKLLDNDTGVITARTPVVTDVQAEICFDGYPENALAVFKYGTGREVYRELVEGKCLIEFPERRGIVKVAVVDNTGTSSPRRWVCEQLQYYHIPSGEVIICPNDSNLPLEFVKLKIENEELRADNKKLHERLDELDARLTKIMEGYDIV